MVDISKLKEDYRYCACHSSEMCQHLDYSDGIHATCKKYGNGFILFLKIHRIPGMNRNMFCPRRCEECIEEYGDQIDLKGEENEHPRRT